MASSPSRRRQRSRGMTVQKMLLHQGRRAEGAKARSLPTPWQRQDTKKRQPRATTSTATFASTSRSTCWHVPPSAAPTGMSMRCASVLCRGRAACSAAALVDCVRGGIQRKLTQGDRQLLRVLPWCAPARRHRAIHQHGLDGTARPQCSLLVALLPCMRAPSVGSGTCRLSLVDARRKGASDCSRACLTSSLIAREYARAHRRARGSVRPAALYAAARRPSARISTGTAKHSGLSPSQPLSHPIPAFAPCPRGVRKLLSFSVAQPRRVWLGGSCTAHLAQASHVGSNALGRGRVSSAGTG